MKKVDPSILTENQQNKLAKKILFLSILCALVPTLPFLIITKSIIIPMVFGLPIFIIAMNIICKLYGVSDADLGVTQTELTSSDCSRRDTAGLHALTVYASLGSAYQSYATSSSDETSPPSYY